MVYTKHVEVGRVAHITYGPDAGKLAVIVDILNTARVLVEGAQVRRQELSLKRVQLTEWVIDIKRGAGRAALKKAIADFGLDKKWNESSWGKKVQRRARRTNLSDFDRFKVMVLKQRVLIY
jgi:large subunit ribosomal protein L14e